MEPEADIWLSFISMPSERLKRWLQPPPIRTAYLSKILSPGIVFRVSVIRVFVPFTASTAAAVWVAIPEARCIRFSAVRSPVRMLRALPLISAIISPFLIRSPSSKHLFIITSPPASSKVRSAIPMPHRTPSSFAIKRPLTRAFSETIAFVVISPYGASSFREFNMIVSKAVFIVLPAFFYCTI